MSLTEEVATRYDGLGQRVELDISGMTCAACANRIEKKLNKMDGVRATVNPGSSCSGASSRTSASSTPSP